MLSGRLYFTLGFPMPFRPALRDDALRNVRPTFSGRLAALCVWPHTLELSGARCNEWFRLKAMQTMPTPARQQLNTSSSPSAAVRSGARSRSAASSSATSCTLFNETEGRAAGGKGSGEDGGATNGGSTDGAGSEGSGSDGGVGRSGGDDGDAIGGEDGDTARGDSLGDDGEAAGGGNGGAHATHPTHFGQWHTSAQGCSPFTHQVAQRGGGRGGKGGCFHGAITMLVSRKFGSCSRLPAISRILGSLFRRLYVPSMDAL